MDAACVADVAVASDAQFEPGAPFTKIWRAANSGSCQWQEGTRLVHVSGEVHFDNLRVLRP